MGITCICISYKGTKGQIVDFQREREGYKRFKQTSTQGKNQSSGKITFEIMTLMTETLHRH